MAGFFIAFEGGEGVGKSTQEALLAQSLTAAGHTVVRTREPGGTPAAEAIRDILLSRDNDGLNPRSEALLFAAARGDHVARVVRPALERGDIVICDRYLDSSVAYQGYARGLGPDRIRDLSLWATENLVPDLTVLLTLDPTIGLSRIGEPDRLEAEPMEYHQRVTQAFVDIAQGDPQRYLIIDAAAQVDEIAARITQRVFDQLGRDPEQKLTQS